MVIQWIGRVRMVTVWTLQAHKLWLTSESLDTATCILIATEPIYQGEDMETFWKSGNGPESPSILSLWASQIDSVDIMKLIALSGDRCGKQFKTDHLIQTVYYRLLQTVCCRLFYADCLKRLIRRDILLAICATFQPGARSAEPLRWTSVRTSIYGDQKSATIAAKCC